MLELRATSVRDTHAIAAAVAAVCRPGDLVVLAGEMGAGKTAFAQGFGVSLGVTEPITSPTFTLVHSYDLPPGNGTGASALHHADLYRLDRTAEVADLALDELAEHQGIVLVEWGDVVDSLFGDHLVVHLEPDLEADLEVADPDDSGDADDDSDVGLDALADGTRWITLSATGSSWAARWSRLVDSCEAFRC